MPRYFFNVQDHSTDPDIEGSELPDALSARREAIRYAADVIGCQADTLGASTPVEWRLLVTDVTGTVLFWLTFTISGLMGG